MTTPSNPKSISVRNPTQWCVSAPPGQRHAPSADALRYTEMSAAEKHEWALRDPEGFGRAHDECRLGPFVPPTKPYAELTFAEKHEWMRRDPEGFARAVRTKGST